MFENLKDRIRSLTPSGRQRIVRRNAARDAVANSRPAIVITGASRGIGKALAKRFSETGKDVVLIARDPDDLSSVVEELHSRRSCRVHAIAIDITAPNTPTDLQTELDRLGLYCDILVNNAGIGASGLFAKEDPQRLASLCSTNVSAPTVLSRQFLPAMIEREQGAILHIGSLGGIIPGPHQAAYYASKSFLIALSEALAHECIGSGVKVCAVLPGPVTTSFHAEMNADQALYTKILPQLTPDQVARSAVRGLKWGRRIVVPGLLNKFMYIALRFLPHALCIPIVAVLLRNPDSKVHSAPD